MTKKSIRAAFRRNVFERDRYACVCCRKAGYDRQGEPVKDKVPLDAHHITPREEMPKGGYVKENGATVCDDCHLQAEEHLQGIEHPGFDPESLYKLIGSSHEAAVKTSEELC